MATKLVKGNTAVIVGAMYGGADCFFGYPITPASEILHEASAYFPKVGRRFVQAESEEAAVNMVYGASAAGHRAMTASSGPGISLMQEGVSYMAGSRLPAVIVNIQRAGPGLGNIGPEQGDYNQATKGGGHGNYRTIVLTPNSVQEMCDMTMSAFDLASRYRIPVYVLADAVLGQMIEPLRFPDTAVTPRIDPAYAVSGTQGTRGNVVTSIFLDFAELEQFNVELQEHYRQIEANEQDWEEVDTGDAEIVIVSYGISSRVSRSVVARARAEGLPVGLLRPKAVYPFPVTPLRALAERGCRLLSVEMSNGQMREDIRLATGCSAPVGLVSRMGGCMMTADEVYAAVREVWAQGGRT